MGSLGDKKIESEHHNVSAEISFEEGFEPIKHIENNDVQTTDVDNPNQSLRNIIGKRTQAISKMFREKDTRVSPAMNLKFFQDDVITKIVEKENFDVCEMLYRIKKASGEKKKASLLLRTMKKVATTPEQQARYEQYKQGDMPEHRLIHD